MPRSALTYGCLATPVVAGEAVLGYLLVLDEASGRADDADLIVTSYAAIVFALALAKTQSSLELGLRYREAIVDSLVSGHFLDSHDARRKACILGVADVQPFRIAVARVSGSPASRRGHLHETELAEELLTRLAGSAPYPSAIRGPELVMLVPEHAPADIPARNAGGGSHSVARCAASPARQLLRHQADAGEVTCGLSELTLWPELAPQALRQARHAIDLGIRLGGRPDHQLRGTRHLPPATADRRHAAAVAVRQ